MTSATRRAPGTGTIEKLPSGRFRPRFFLDGVRQKLGSFATEPEAQEALDGARQLAVDGHVRTAGADTLQSYGATWLDALEQSGRRSMAGVRSQWSVHVDTASFAALPMRAITRSAVKAWHGRLKLARGSAKNVLGFVRQCLEDALDEQLIESNPAVFRRKRRKRVDMPSDPDADQAWTYLTPKEQLLLETTTQLGEHDRDLLLFLLYTGVRIGEALTLRRADVFASHIVIRYGSVPSGPTKNGLIREVPLIPQAIPVLQRQLARLDEPRCRNRHGLFWPAPRGGFLAVNHPLGRRGSKNGGHDTWIEVREKIFGRRVRIHDLRHTCASSLVAGWFDDKPWDLYEVKTFLGHSSISVTQRYAHLAPSVLREKAARMGARQPTAKPTALAITLSARGSRAGCLSSACTPPSPVNSRGSAEPWASRGLRGRVLDALKRLEEPGWNARLRKVAGEIERLRIDADPVLRTIAASRTAGEFEADRLVEALGAWLNTLPQQATAPVARRKDG